MSSFRPIAPAHPHMDVYAASCNPSRRVKRPRSQSDASPDDLPPPPSPSPPDPDDHAPTPKRRGRRPGTLSRAAREAQRKINHSLIEKARRTKINDALATLRMLVPPEYKRPSDAHPEDEDEEDEELDPRKPRQKPKAAGEKEFKLEILVRTVAYLQDLTDKVTQLQHSGCPRCSEPISLSSVPIEPRQRHHDDRASSRSSSLASHSRLPSISAWLPSSAEEQRPLLMTPSQSPAFDPAMSARQLPTPPTSATCPPATTGFSMPPVLTLPSPSTLLPTPHMQPRFSGFTSRVGPSVSAHARTSPLSSPVYTPDDETAASLLLRMSNTSPRTSSAMRPAESKHGSKYALTPSRLLGLNGER